MAEAQHRIASLSSTNEKLVQEIQSSTTHHESLKASFVTTFKSVLNAKKRKIQQILDANSDLSKRVRYLETRMDQD